MVVVIVFPDVEEVVEVDEVNLLVEVTDVADTVVVAEKRRT